MEEISENGKVFMRWKRRNIEKMIRQEAKPGKKNRWRGGRKKNCETKCKLGPKKKQRSAADEGVFRGASQWLVVCVPCEEEVFGEDCCIGVEAVWRDASSIKREICGCCIAGGGIAFCEKSCREMESCGSYLVAAAKQYSGTLAATDACELEGGGFVETGGSGGDTKRK